MRRIFATTAAIFFVLPAAAVHAWGDQPTGPALKPRFERDVLPILVSRCAGCHGAGKREGGLDLRQQTSILKGGESGAAIVPGKPAESLLLEKIAGGEMPPKPNKPLTAEEIARIRDWIASASQSPAKTAAADGVAVESHVSKDQRQFWAFQSPVRPSVPKIKGADRLRTPIDTFVLARLEDKGLSFNPDAPRNILLRRLSFDLLGLPPTPDQLREFLGDERPDSYERLVDRILSSPQYGERWARHWLDVAGYADSDGYLAADRERPEAWRYRDYVIDAHNSDLPIDQFIFEQLAGDEMSDWRTAEHLTPEMVRQLTATGFLRTALDPTYPGYAEPNEIHQVLSDTTQIVGSSLFGLTIQCARCHAHKTDPISQGDYYALQSVFLPALNPARWQVSGQRGIPLATPAERSRIEANNRKVDQQLKSLTAQLEPLALQFRKRRVQELLGAHSEARADSQATGASDPQLVEKIVAALMVKPNKRSAEQRRFVAQILPGKSGRISDADLAARYPEFKVQYDKLTSAISAARTGRRSLTVLRGLCDLEGPFPQGRILVRGDYHKPGAAVVANVPAVLRGEPTAFEPQPRGKSSGRRTALARWLTRPDHPLTSRVQVNRIWARHFGRGLVATSANFGHSGARPTHPELLDWLATELVRQRWSVKALHRLIVTSTVYRQSADVDSAKVAADPDNLLLGAWQPRRFEGEELRDGVLAVAGELNPAMLGAPSAVILHADGSVTTTDDAKGRRRTIYLQVRRSQQVTLLDLFDTPVMEINCPERNVSTVPVQALAMLHGRFAEQSAASLGRRVYSAATTDEDRLDFAYRLLFAKEPNASERAAVLAFVRKLVQAAARSPDERTALKSAWNQVALVLLNSNAFVYVE